MKTQLIAHGVIGGRYTKRFPIVGGDGGLVILRKYSGFYNITHAGSGLAVPGFFGDLRRCRRLLPIGAGARGGFGCDHDQHVG